MGGGASERFRRNVLRAAEARGLTQMKLAAKAGLRNCALSRLLLGQQRVQLDAAVALAEALEAPIGVLLDEGPDDSGGGPSLMLLSADEKYLVKCARTIGLGAAYDRILGIAPPGQQLSA